MTLSVARLFAIAWLAAVAVAPLAAADDSVDRAAIEKAAQAWVTAFNARDAKALVSLATEDVVLIDPTRSPVTGERAREAWKRAAGVSQGTIASVSKEIVISGDVAWRIAAWGDRTRPAQMLEIWKRVGGQWKIHRQMTSNLVTPSNLLPPPSEPVLDRPAN